MKKVNVAIIGGGNAGLTAYHEVVKANKTALIIDPLVNLQDGLDCHASTNQAFLRIAHDYYHTHTFSERGIKHASLLKVDFPLVMHHARQLKKHQAYQISKKIAPFKENFIKGTPEFFSPHLMKVRGNFVVAERTILAPGSRPFIPQHWQSFASRLFTSENFCELTQKPKSMAIIGLGDIGIEFGQAMRYLGVEVAGFSTGSFVGGASDPAVNDCAKKNLRKEFPLHFNAHIDLSHDGHLFIVHCGSQKYTFEKVFVALGRVPNLDNLGLERLALAHESNGLPCCNPSTMRLAGSPLYLAGNLRAEKALAQQDADEGFIAGYNAACAEDTPFVRRTPLSIVSSDPCMCFVGQKFAALDPECTVVGETHFGDRNHFFDGWHKEGILRVYADRTSQKILGAEMFCPAGEQIAQLLSFCIEQEFTVKQALLLPIYHQAVEEGLKTALQHLMNQFSPQSTTFYRLNPKEHFNMTNKSPEISSTETLKDINSVLSLGLPTPSQDIATGDLRNDSLQNIMSLLAHQTYPAHKQDLLLCAQSRDAAPEVIEFLSQLPDQTYPELSAVIGHIKETKSKAAIIPESCV